MANKMISEEDLRDDFLKTLIKADEPLPTPEGFLDNIMERLGPVPAVSPIKPYKPPVWLKWGIPGVILSLLLVAIIQGVRNSPSTGVTFATSLSDAFSGFNSWFAGLGSGMKFPVPDIPSTVTWGVLGAIALFWGFLLLGRFLEKRIHR